jgi:hypothetical protein
MKNAVFWGVAPCRYGHAGSSIADFSTLKMEAIRSSETSVQSTTSTRRHTPEDVILHVLISLKYLYIVKTQQDALLEESLLFYISRQLGVFNRPHNFYRFFPEGLTEIILHATSPP